MIFQVELVFPLVFRSSDRTCSISANLISRLTWRKERYAFQCSLSPDLIRFFHRSHNTVHFGGVFALKQWIISSLKHDTVPRVDNLYCFYVKNPIKRVALWDRENSQLRFYVKHQDCIMRKFTPDSLKTDRIF